MWKIDSFLRETLRVDTPGICAYRWSLLVASLRHQVSLQLGERVAAIGTD